MGASLLIATALCIGIAAALAAAVATAHVVVRKRQNDIAVSFADLPRAAPPKPKMASVTKPRGAVRKAAAAPPVAPKGIPAERPEEAEGDLVAAGDVGPVDGFIQDKAPPPAPPPPKTLPAPEPAPEQRRETIEPPQFLSGCPRPEPPDSLRSLAATIQIDVRMLIDAQGKVQSAQIVTPHPMIPDDLDDLILRCAREQLYKPAHLPDGTAVVYPVHRRFTFKPMRV